MHDRSVCLDMLEPPGQPGTTNEDGENIGWTPAYTIHSILVQLQSFLFEANLSTILRDINDPKQYERRKKEWLSAVTWSVEQSRNYSDKTVGHFPPRKPWPPVSDEVAQPPKTREEKLREELVCFYTRQTFEEDTLGYGISFTKNLRTGEISQLKAQLDYISLRAFMNHKVRTASNQESFTHFLPVYLNEKHGQKAMHLAKRALSIICTGSHNAFRPEQALFVLPKLMNTMVVQVMQGSKHHSTKALNAYCNFHRLLLQFIIEYPELQQTIDEQVDLFIHQGKYRLKEHLPNLGDFLAMLSVSNFEWKDIEDAYINESFTRNVFWILNKYPELADFENTEFDEEDRINYSFEVSHVSQKILLFQLFFMQNLAQPQGKSKTELAKEYDAVCAVPSLSLEMKFLDRMTTIQNVSTYQEFFLEIGKDLSSSEISKMLHNATLASEAKGYHGSKSENILSPEEYSRQSRKFDIDQFATLNADGKTYTLVENETAWKEMCEKRFGFTELPAYLQDDSCGNPWRKLYLQHNLQDVVSQLNDNPDFPHFHKTCDVSQEIPRIEILMFDPTAIKSRFFFLTILLSKLTSLKTLIIRKGSEGLSRKGFKALTKGLAYSDSQMENLILEHCNITSHAIQELTNGENRLQSNVKRLNLSSNRLGDDGAKNLANFLKRHDNLPDLEELNLSQCNIGNMGAKSIAESLLTKRRLKKLIMTNNPCSNGLDSILQNLSYSNSIETIFASNSGSVNSSDSKSLGLLLDLSVSVRKLNLWKVDLSKVQASAVMALTSNQRLEELDIASTNFQQWRSLGRALAGNTTLKVLNLDSNHMTLAHIADFVEDFSLAFAEPLNQSILAKNPEKIIHLEKLSLSHNIFTEFRQSDDTLAKTWSEFFKRCRKLRELDLQACNLNDILIKFFAQALLPEEKVPLEVLNLRGNNTSKYMKYLSAALEQNTSIKSLDLSGNSLGVKGSSLVAEVIARNTTLEELNLFGNFSEIEGCISISKALEKNTSLRKLDLGLNRIRERGCRNLVASLKHNSTLQSLSLKHNHLGDGVALALAKQIVEDSNNEISYLAFAGNPLTARIRAEIALLLARAPRTIELDVSNLVQFKVPEVQERTIYMTPLPKQDPKLLALEIKKSLYAAKVGAIKSVHVYEHKTKVSNKSAQYAFVEFAHMDSVQLAMNLVHKGYTIAGQTVRIQRSGVQGENSAKNPQPERKASKAPRSVYSTDIFD